MKSLNKEAFPSLTPIVAPWVDQLLADPEYINQLFDRHGSPLNVHYTGAFLDNYNKYAQVLEEHELDHLILFARKANKCKFFVKAAVKAGFGVDTASYRELEQCLDMGCDPQKIVLTAAVKNEELLSLAIANDILTIVDNLDELNHIQRLAKGLGKKVSIGIRISGFVVDGEKLYSRFGFDVDEVAELIIRQLKSNELLNFQGFHFHLNGYSPRERAEALVSTILLSDQLAEEGMDTQFIDIGGGLLMNYLKSEKEWKDFEEQLRLAVSGEREPITFQNNGLGYKMIHGKLTGQLKTYPFFNQCHKENFLDHILSYETGKGSIAQQMKDRNISFRMEPGRSLLDQTGITLAKVVFRKRDSLGNLLIGLDMNRTQLFSSSADFLLDPMVINQRQPKKSEKTAGYLVGAYCLEQDVILKRKINLKCVPEVGDIVCFPNTAGYMMHFYESEAHLFKLSKNLVVQNGAS